jgi:hypothetical protein
MVTAVNYEFADLTPAPVPIANLDCERAAKLLPRRGGFLGERALKRALLGYHDRLAHAGPGDPRLKQYPVFILLGRPAHAQPPGSLVSTSEMTDFERLAPDYEACLASFDKGDVASLRLTSLLPERAADAGRPVALLRAGDAVAPCLLNTGAATVIHFDASQAERSVSVLEAGAFRPFATTTTLSPDLPYARGVGGEQQVRNLKFNPSLGNRGLREIVEMSRETGIMLAATSYVVMESNAQWEILKRKEQQKLKGHSALEFEQVPEPASALLLLAGGAALLARRRRYSGGTPSPVSSM